MKVLQSRLFCSFPIEVEICAKHCLMRCDVCIGCGGTGRNVHPRPRRARHQEPASRHRMNALVHLLCFGTLAKSVPLRFRPPILARSALDSLLPPFRTFSLCSANRTKNEHRFDFEVRQQIFLKCQSDSNWRVASKSMNLFWSISMKIVQLWFRFDAKIIDNDFKLWKNYTVPETFILGGTRRTESDWPVEQLRIESSKNPSILMRCCFSRAAIRNVWTRLVANPERPGRHQRPGTFGTSGNLQSNSCRMGSKSRQNVLLHLPFLCAALAQGVRRCRFVRRADPEAHGVPAGVQHLQPT